MKHFNIKSFFAEDLLIKLIIYIFLSIFLFSLYKLIFDNLYNSKIYILLLLLSFFNIIILILIIFIFSKKFKIYLSIIIYSVILGIYSFEFYLYKFNNSNLSSTKIIDTSNHDKRGKYQVLKELINSGVDAYPNISPSHIIGTEYLKNSKQKILPLGMISNVTTLLSNESGYWPIVKTDEIGFHNPKGTYTKEAFEIVLIGDSFTEGFSVRTENNISSNLRLKGYENLNLGKLGTGSLIHYAMLREYVIKTKPKIVLWMYHENDINDLSAEIKSTILLNYLKDEKFSQNLVKNQDKIDKFLINFSEIKSAEHANNKDNKSNLKLNLKNEILIFLKLSKLRNKLNFRPIKSDNVYLNNNLKLTFQQIMENSKKIVSKFDGNLIFAYLPSANTIIKKSDHPHKKFIVQTIKNLDIKFLDLQNDLFLKQDDPILLFPYKNAWLHYNETGYEMISEKIIEYIKKMEKG